jgi:hypothetical protein
MGVEARKRYGPLQHWVDHPEDRGGLGKMLETVKGLEENVILMLKELLDKRLDYAKRQEDGEEFHSAEQNARLIAGEHCRGENASYLTLSS